MSDLSIKERLRPVLLDRLTDHHPEQHCERAEDRIVNTRDLKISVQRDLEWLFNTTHLASDLDMERYPEVRSSVLNFGIQDIHSLYGKSSMDIENVLYRAILDYEPRILPESLSVYVLSSEKRESLHRIEFQIEGELWTLPLPQQLFLRTEMDLLKNHFELHSKTQKEIAHS